MIAEDPRHPSPQGAASGWYMAQKNGQNLVAFRADSDADATRKIATLQQACSDPTVLLTWVPLTQSQP